MEGMKRIKQDKQIVTVLERKDLIPVFLTLIEAEWPSVLPFVRRQLEDSLREEDDKEGISATFFLLVKGEPAGLVQTNPREFIQKRKDLFPCIGPLFVAKKFRGSSFGEKLLARARWELGRRGYDAAYFTSDHIGFYERYGCREIGLDLYENGRPVKIYECGTFL